MRDLRKIKNHAAPNQPSLPDGVEPDDLKCAEFESPDYISWKDKEKYPGDGEFEMWHVASFGWCIPTLHIRNPGRRSTQNTARTYAVRVSDGGVVRIGMGPHVTKTVRVYVKKSNLARLQKFFELREKGSADSNTIRDRISTRRAQTALRRDPLSWLR